MPDGLEVQYGPSTCETGDWRPTVHYIEKRSDVANVDQLGLIDENATRAKWVVYTAIQRLARKIDRDSTGM